MMDQIPSDDGLAGTKISQSYEVCRGVLNSAMSSCLCAFSLACRTAYFFYFHNSGITQTSAKIFDPLIPFGIEAFLESPME